jgi:hypothetical protein
MNDINFARARDFNDLDIAGISKSHGTCQVRGRISSKLAAKRNNNGIKIFHYRTPSSKASTLLMTWSSSYQLS